MLQLEPSLHQTLLRVAQHGLADQDLESTAFGLRRPLTATLGVTVRRADHDFVADAVALEYLAAALHRRTIRLAAHDYPDQGSVAHWGTADSISRSARSCR